jgi:hypothetical protein
MGEHRVSMIERVVNRVEEHIEEWRKRDAALAAEAEANRDQLWAAAAERERMLARVIGEEDARDLRWGGRSPGQSDPQHQGKLRQGDGHQGVVARLRKIGVRVSSHCASGAEITGSLRSLHPGPDPRLVLGM